MDVREFRRVDGEAVRAPWIVAGIGIRPGGDDTALEAFARRNEGLFFLGEERAHRRERPRGPGRAPRLAVSRRGASPGSPHRASYVCLAY